MGRRGKREKREKGSKKGFNKKILLITLAIVVLIIGGVFAYSHFAGAKNRNSNEVNLDENGEDESLVGVVKKLNIVDVNSKSRPYAVMINNNHAAWPQCGLKDAYIVYEIIAEGGITRMMAVYKDQDTAKIGSVRSARHYFIDYAEENDAIFVHWGGSPQAYNRIYTGIDDIDGIALEGSVFFRDTSLKRDYEHTGFTSMEKLKKYAKEKGLARDTNKDLLLNYSASSIDIKDQKGAQSAQEVEIKYSDYHRTNYVYDKDTKTYKRSMSGVANVDLVTGEQYTAKNILVYNVSNYTLNDGENKGRQEINNIGTGTGYFITEGYAVPITWEKTSHSGQTVYKYSDGTEITVNDGNTFIQIYPTTTGKLTITPDPELATASDSTND